MYVYVESETGLWTVGFYDPDGTWHPEGDHPNPGAAARRVAWLNGAGGKKATGTPEHTADSPTGERGG